MYMKMLACRKKNPEKGLADDMRAIGRSLIAEIVSRKLAESFKYRVMHCACEYPTIIDCTEFFRYNQFPPYYKCFICSESCCYSCGQIHANPGNTKHCAPSDNSCDLCPRCRKPYDLAEGCNHITHDCHTVAPSSSEKQICKPIHWCHLCGEVFGIGFKGDMGWYDNYTNHYKPNARCTLYGKKASVAALAANPMIDVALHLLALARLPHPIGAALDAALAANPIDAALAANPIDAALAANPIDAALAANLIDAANEPIGLD